MSPAEHEDVHWYGSQVDREVSRLLRVFSLDELLAAARRLRKRLEGRELGRRERLNLLADETKRLARRLAA